MKSTFSCIIKLFALLCICHQNGTAQDAPEQLNLTNFPNSYFEQVSGKLNSVEEKLDAATNKALSRLQKQQEKLKKTLYRKDSLAAMKIFHEAENRYRKFQATLENPRQSLQYIPYLDTLKTALKFLDKNKDLLLHVKGVDNKLRNSIGALDELEGQFHKAELVRQFLREQQLYIKNQLNNFGFTKQLKQINKDLYYYSRQLSEYREIIRDPKKIERKAIDLVSRTRLFKDFMKKNSMLSSLFRMPANDPDNPVDLQGLSGLQTRAQVTQIVQDQFGNAGPTTLRQMQNNVQHGRDQFQQLKDKITRYGGNSDDLMPDGFKPNPQKTKSFFKRLELGSNIQTKSAQYYFPVTSALGVSVGYKLNEKSVVGFGASYVLGLGQGWKNIRLTQEGAGLRSFIDWKLKGSIWISGGFEANYSTAFSNISQLQHLRKWQQSGLIGISRTTPINSNIFKVTKLQLLWDFLSYQQVPRTQALLFRIGYGF